MVPELNDPIWEKIIKRQIKPKQKEFLLCIYIFIVIKNYDLRLISLEQAKKALYDFFRHYENEYDITSYIKND